MNNRTDVEKVKHLRESTGLSFGEIKKALDEAGGDEIKAVEILKAHGIKVAENKSSREVKEGVIVSYIHATKKLGSMVEVLCETDFVARNDDFQDLAREIAMHIAAMRPENVDELLGQPYVNKLIPEAHVSTQSNIGKDILGELFPELLEGFKNLKLREYGNLWFVELEKLLRRLRVISLKMDRISESWIKKIRKGNVSRITTQIVTEKTEVVENPVIKVQTTPQTTIEDMKREEQKLIIEIAKNPKDSKLYEILGDLYVKMNNLSDAKESFEAAMELNPGSEIIQKKISQVMEKVVI